VLSGIGVVFIHRRAEAASRPVTEAIGRRHWCCPRWGRSDRRGSSGRTEEAAAWCGLVRSARGSARGRSQV
jgi:hypothetical protein